MTDTLQIHDIYDRIFKKVLTLSSTSIINLINGLFKTNYPPDSTVTYNWTEFHDENVKKILADTIITINGKYSYHLEAQMTKDNEIIFRVFEYGYHHAMRQQIKGVNELVFPEPMVIYLYYEGQIPDEYILRLNFGSQGYFDYKAQIFNFLDTPVSELNKRKMIILIPFQLLKLRKLIEKERSQTTLDMLKSLILNDIIGSVNENLRLGNITKKDAVRLTRLSLLLYNHLYSHYDEMKELNEMTDESLMLDIDIMEKKYETQIAEMDQQIAEMDRIIDDKESIIADKENIIASKNSIIADKESVIANKDNIIADRESVIANKDNIIADRESVIADKDNIIADRESVIADKDNIIADRESVIADKDNIIADKERIIASMNDKIKLLQGELSKLKNH